MGRFGPSLEDADVTDENPTCGSARAVDLDLEYSELVGVSLQEATGTLRLVIRGVFAGWASRATIGEVVAALGANRRRVGDTHQEITLEYQGVTFTCRDLVVAAYSGRWLIGPDHPREIDMLQHAPVPGGGCACRIVSEEEVLEFRYESLDVTTRPARS